MLTEARTWVTDPRRRLVIGLALLVVVAAAIVLWSPKEIIDDAFISYRHAGHLADGDGLTWNPSGPHVEGFTNLTWTLLSTVPILLGIPVWKAMASLGFVLAVATVVEVVRFGRRLGARVGALLTGAALLVAYPAFWRVAVSGLEGPLYALLLVEIVGRFATGGRPWVVGVLGGVAFATRPESLLVLPVLAVVAVVAEDRMPARALARTAAVWLAIVGGVTLWRLAYYGAALPTSFSAKRVPVGDFDQLRANLGPGWAYVRDAAGRALALVGALLAGLVVAPRHRVVAAAAGVVVLGGVVACANAGDWMSDDRLLSVYGGIVALAAVVASDAVAWLFQSLPPAWSTVARRAALVVLVALMAAGLAAVPWRASPSTELALPAPAYGPVTAALDDALDDGDVVLAEAAGRVGYELLDQPMHDFNGLADPYIAKHGILVSPFGRIDLRYTIDDVHPTVMVFHGGTVHFLGMLAASTRNSGADYDLYSVGPVTDLSGPFMLLAVEDDAAARLLPRLEDLDLHRITVSG